MDNNLPREPIDSSSSGSDIRQPGAQNNEGLYVDYSQYTENTENNENNGAAPGGNAESSLLAENMSRGRRVFNIIGFSLLLVLVVTYVVQFAAVRIIGAVFPAWLQSLTVLMLISALSMNVLGMGSGWLFLRGQKTSPPERKKINLGQWLIVLLISFGAMYTCNLIGNIFTSVMSALLGKDIANPLTDMLLGIPMWLVILLTVIMAPLIEELFFRKLLIDRMLPYGERTAVFVSALFFGLFHGNFSQFFYAFAIGLILGFLYCKTGNVKYTIAIHFVINLFGSIGSLLMMRILNNINLGDGSLSDINQITTEVINTQLGSILLLLLYVAFIFAVWLAGVVLFFVFIKKYRFKRPELALSERPGDNFKMIFLNPGIICALVFCVGLMISSLLR